MSRLIARRTCAGSIPESGSSRTSSPSESSCASARGEGDALLLTDAQRRVGSFGQVIQLEPSQRIIDSVGRRRQGVAAKAHDLAHRERGRDLRPLRHVGDALGSLSSVQLVNRDAADEHPSRGGALGADACAQER